MGQKDIALLLSSLGFLASLSGLVLYAYAEEGRLLLITALALVGLAMSLVAILRYGTAQKSARGFFSILMSVIVLFNVGTGYYADKRVSNVLRGSLDPDTQLVIDALDAYRNDTGACPKELADLYPDYLASLDLIRQDDGSDVYGYVIAEDTRTCSVTLRVGVE